ncbi:hypothetical protein FQA39_LY03735 [Lamprigera yunnana]|nr:hypothetical protein FQA39_LY03735 [Lamprigera yunnana]
MDQKLGRKFGQKLTKNSGLQVLYAAADILSRNDSEPDHPLLVQHTARLKFASITSVNVERSLSVCKSFLSDERQVFVMENVDKDLVIKSSKYSVQLEKSHLFNVIVYNVLSNAGEVNQLEGIIMERDKTKTEFDNFQRRIYVSFNYINGDLEETILDKLTAEERAKRVQIGINGLEEYQNAQEIDFEKSLVRNKIETTKFAELNLVLPSAYQLTQESKVKF